MIKKQIENIKQNLYLLTLNIFQYGQLIKKCKSKKIDQIIITASGGPFFKLKNKKIKKTPKLAIKSSKLENGKKNFY